MMSLLLLGWGARAQNPVDATIDTNDILYWVGTGSNRAVLIVNFGIPDTALAWGFRFDGSATVQQMTDSITAADPRFWVVGLPSYYPDGDIFYIMDNGDTLKLSGRDDENPWNYWEANINGGVSYSGASQTLTDGDVFKYGDQRSPTRVCVDFYSGYCMQSAWTKTPVPVPDPFATNDVEENSSVAGNVLYWIGEGNHEVVFAVNWADAAYAWGYRFYEPSVTVSEVMDAIQATDPRFSYSLDQYGYLDDISFIDGDDTLTKAMYSYWEHKLNGQYSMGMGSEMVDGDFSKWADPAAGVVVDSFYYEEYYFWSYSYNYGDEIQPVKPVESTIAAADIVNWIGQGSNSVVFAVDWASRALAWGYRFNGESVDMVSLMDSIQAGDPRFSYTTDMYGYLSNILFVSGVDTLQITPYNYFENKVNGFYSAGMGASLHNGDFTKWADPAGGVIADSTYYQDDYWSGWMYSYVYTRPIYPVSVYAEHGPFCGPVETEGCDAIAASSNIIKGWATGCTVERGYNSIMVAGPRADYGDDTMALGPVSMTDNLTVVSLGDAGVATLTFDKPITNGAGADFAVYENGFGDYFLELAFVEVSSDGERFVRFPATSLTPTDVQVSGMGVLDATNLNNLAGKYRKGYGTPFDLNELRDSTGLDVNNVTHVRIVDVVGSIIPYYASRDHEGRIINDPWPTNNNKSGFDLAGVAVINQLADGIEGVEASVAVYPNPATDRLYVSVASQCEGQLYDMAGRQVMGMALESGTNVIDLGGLPQGIFLLRAAGKVQKIVKK